MKINKKVKRHILDTSPWWIIKKCKACLYPGHYGEMELTYIREDRAAYERRHMCYVVGCVSLLAGIIVGLLIAMQVT